MKKYVKKCIHLGSIASLSKVLILLRKKCGQCRFWFHTVATTYICCCLLLWLYDTRLYYVRQESPL